MTNWEPLGGYNFAEDRVTLPPGYTIAPAFASGHAQLLEGEPHAFTEVGAAIKWHSAFPLGRLVCEVSGGTKAEARIHCQLIFGKPGALANVDWMGAREELTAHPEFIGETLAKLASQKAG